MNELHIKYKSDTGKKVFIEFETELYIKSLSDFFLDDCEKDELIAMIEGSEDEWCITQDELEKKISPSHNFNNGNINIHSLEYIQWLEDKIHKLVNYINP